MQNGNTLPDPSGRSATTPAARGAKDFSPRGQRGRPPAAQNQRTRFPATPQGRPRNTDKQPARNSRTPRTGSRRERSTGSKHRSRSLQHRSRSRQRRIRSHPHRNRTRSRVSRRSRSRSRHSGRHRANRSVTSSTLRVVCARQSSQSSEDLARDFRLDLLDKHAFLGFSRSDFSRAARMFWPNVYHSVDAAKEMDTREREMFLSQVKSDHGRSRNRLSDMRLVFRIFARFGPSAKLRDPARGGEEIDISRRMRTSSADLSTITGPLHREQDMANFFSDELERGRCARPPYTPYVTTDSLAAHPWLPSGDPHTKALSPIPTPHYPGLPINNYRRITFSLATRRKPSAHLKIPSPSSTPQYRTYLRYSDVGLFSAS